MTTTRDITTGTVKGVMTLISMRLEDAMGVSVDVDLSPEHVEGECICVYGTWDQITKVRDYAFTSGWKETRIEQVDGDDWLLGISTKKI